MALSLAGAAVAGQIDVIDSADAQPGTYFTPTDAQKLDSPYYRDYSGDWGWTHNALTDPFAVATLNISAYDVDYSSGERDEIFAWDTQSSAWLSLGFLAGGDNIWQFSSFGVLASLFDEVGTGLKVRIDIDTTHTSPYWGVSLAKSTLTTDGEGPGNPNPGVPDSGDSLLLLGLGLGALQLFRRRCA